MIRYLKALAIFLLLISTGASNPATAAGKKSDYVEQVYVIRPPKLPTAPRVDIMEYHVRIKGGMVRTVENMRGALVTNVVNSSSWGATPDNPTRIDGSVQMSWIDRDEFSTLRFHIVRDIKAKLEIAGWLQVIENEDDTHPKTIELKPENFQVVK